MQVLQILAILVTCYNLEAKIPPGIHGPWQTYSAGVFPEMPFPHLPYTDEYPPANFDSCGGTINRPTVITTSGYPFNTAKQSCKWILTTRRCFIPRVTVLSTLPNSSPSLTVMQFTADKTVSFAGAAPGTEFDGVTNYAEVKYESQVENVGNGFQVSVDFIPEMTQECLAGFQYLPEMTCVPTEIEGDSFVVRTPGNPSKQVPPGFACKHSAIVDDKLRNYDVTITSSLAGGERLVLKELFSSITITNSTPTVTISTTKPFFFMYAADSGMPSSGFTAKVKPSEQQAPSPCNTVITVVTNDTAIENPYTVASTGMCTIVIRTDSAAKKLVFNFDEFNFTNKEAARLYTQYLNGESFVTLTGKRAPVTGAQEAIFSYKPGTTVSKWKVRVFLA